MNNLKHIRFWGAATAAHQVEGGNQNQWTVWEKSNAVRLASEAPDRYEKTLKAWSRIQKQATDPANYISGSAVDHYVFYKGDFDIMKKLNMNAYRFSIEWSRIEPKEGKWDKAEIAHYKKYVKELRKRDIEPILTLWHWTMPTWFTDRGGFEKRSNVKYFVRYAKKIIDEIGDDITFVVTLNEPNVYSLLSYGIGLWVPNHRNYWLYSRVMSNLAEAHVQTYIALRSKHHHLAVGSAYHLTHFEGIDFVGKQYAKASDYFWNWRWLDKTKHAHDFLGINHYQTEVFKGLKRQNFKAKQSDFGWKMRPENIEHVIMKATRRYRKAIFITENGLADAADKDRKWWLDKTMAAMSRAIGKGAVIEGYLHWSLLDNFEWADGFWPKFGLVKVNRKTMKRTIRPSAHHYASIIKKYK